MVLFVVLGVFILICLNVYLLEFIILVDKIIVKGVDVIYCVFVNDVFVMKVWGEVYNVEYIYMFVDGDVSFIKVFGLDKDIVGFGGVCLKCYVMIVEN